MIDFSTLKGLTIPVDKETATITLKGDFMWSGVRYNGVYYGSNTVTPVTFTANIGDEIFIETYGAEDAYIALNGKEVANEPGEAEYYYTVVGDTVIEATADGSGYDSSSSIDITARRAGVVTQIADASGRVLWSAKPKVPIITVNAVGTTNGSYIYIPNAAEATWTLMSNYTGSAFGSGVGGYINLSQSNWPGPMEVPIDSIITCTAKIIRVNGAQVATNQYDYIVTRSATFTLANDYIAITET